MPLLLEEVYLSLIFGAPALGTVLLVTLTVGRRLSPFFFSLSLSLYKYYIYGWVSNSDRILLPLGRSFFKDRYFSEVSVGSGFQKIEQAGEQSGTKTCSDHMWTSASGLKHGRFRGFFLVVSPLLFTWIGDLR